MHLDILRERQLMYMKIYSLVVSPCENYLAAATSAGTVALFKLNKGTLGDKNDAESNQMYEIPVLANKAYSVASNANFLFCGDSRGIIRSWRWENLAAKIIAEPAFAINIADYAKQPRFANGSFDVNSLFSVSDPTAATASHLYAGCGDANIYCFDLSCGRLIRTFEGHKDFIHQIVYSSSKQQLFSCGEDGLIKIWDTRSSQPVHSISPSARKGVVNPGGDWVGCIAVDSSGDWLAFGGGVQMGIYNTTMASFAATLEPARLQAHAALFTGDKLLFGGESCSSLYCYSVDGKLQNEIPLGIKDVFALASCLDNKITCVAGGGAKVELIRHFAYRAMSLTVS